MSSILDSNRPEHDREPTSDWNVDVIVDDSVIGAMERVAVDASVLKRGMISAAAYRGYRHGNLILRLTDNATIHDFNRRFMNHDYPTDVISFGYEDAPPRVEGEMIVSVEMAIQRAEEIGWASRNELLLYAVHGTLHIAGMDDQDDFSRSQMRRAEREVLSRVGVDVIDEQNGGPANRVERSEDRA